KSSSVLRIGALVTMLRYGRTQEDSDDDGDGCGENAAEETHRNGSRRALIIERLTHSHHHRGQHPDPYEHEDASGHTGHNAEERCEPRCRSETKRAKQLAWACLRLGFWQ